MFEYYINYVLTYTAWSLVTLFQDFCNKKRIDNKIVKKEAIQYADIYIKILGTVTFNVYILSMPGAILLPYFVNLQDKEVTIINTCTDLVLSYLLSDLFFYITHRSFHSKLLFKYHKKHHELNAPVGMGALYMSGVELYGNLIPVILGPVLISATSLVMHIWIFIAVTNTIIISHTNYKNWSEFHDRHHAHRSCNYGIGGLMDYIFCTKYNPKKYKSKKSDDNDDNKLNENLNSHKKINLFFDNVYNHLMEEPVDEI